MARNLWVNLLPGIRAQQRLCRRLIGDRAQDRAEPHAAKLLAFVRERNPYYRALLGRGADFSALAPLTKAIIRERLDQLQSAGADSPTFRNSSGGSTGQPQTLVQDLEYDRWTRATESYYYQTFLGVNAHDVKKVVLWGSRRDSLRAEDIKGRLANWLSNTIFLNTFTGGEAEWERSIEVINRAKPHFVKGYAVSLYQLAKLAKKRNLRLFAPRFVLCSAQMLEDFMRKEIEEAFNAKVHDFYGSREVGPIAGECKAGRKHIFSFNNVVEVVDQAGKPLAHGLGRVLVTNLHNYSMPLIRYEIGDMGSLGEGSCPCGSRLPWLEKIKGRITDYFIMKDRTLVYGGYFAHLFFFREWVREFQISQLDYEKLEIAVVKDQNAGAADGDIKEIEDKIRFVLGKECRIAWKFVPSIPPTPQGKHLYTRCLISR